MMAYINTDVIACLKKELCELECKPDKISGIKARFLRRIISQIEGYKIADVAEVKHGEWIQEWELEKGSEDNDEIPYVKCSLCGHIEWNIDKERNTTPNYCSKCGAKMDGGEEE